MLCVLPIIIIIIIAPEVDSPLISVWCPTLIWTTNPVGARVSPLVWAAAKEDNPDRKHTLIQ